MQSLLLTRRLQHDPSLLALPSHQNTALEEPVSSARSSNTALDEGEQRPVDLENGVPEKELKKREQHEMDPFLVDFSENDPLDPKVRLPLPLLHSHKT
jgi:hypothetical protein